MATLAERMQGERMARVALSMVAEPNDAAPGSSSPRSAVSRLCGWSCPTIRCRALPARMR